MPPLANFIIPEHSLHLEPSIFDNIYNLASLHIDYNVISGIINSDGLKSPILSDDPSEAEDGESDAYQTAFRGDRGPDDAGWDQVKYLTANWTPKLGR